METVGATVVDITTLPNDQPLARPAPMGTASVRGAFWFSFGALCTKLATLATHLLLSWILIPAEFGIAATVSSIASIGALVHSAGFRELLVQRQQSFGTLARKVYWLALAANCLVAIAIAALAPVAAAVFREPRIAGLTLIAALHWPLSSLAIVAEARLSIDLRFREIVVIQIGKAIVMGIAAVSLAFLGMGAAAIVWSLIPGALWVAAASFYAVGRAPLDSTASAASRDILPSAIYLSVASFLGNAARHAIIAIVAFLNSAEVAGLFFWGFSLASQAVYILAANLQRLFFPTFSKLSGDPERQYRGFILSLRMLTAALAPVCMLQILLARPLIGSFFPDRWLPTAPIVQWISLSLILEPLVFLPQSLLKAHGFFRGSVGLSATGVCLVSSGAVLGSHYGGISEIAQGVAIGKAIYSLLGGLIVTRIFKKDIIELLSAVSLPIAICGGSFVLAAACHNYLQSSTSVTGSLVTSVGALVLYGVGAWYADRETIIQLVSRVRRALASGP